MITRYFKILFWVLLFGLITLPSYLSAASITEKRANIGEKCSATGENSTAMGFSTTANDYYSTAMGISTYAGGAASTAMGWDTRADGAGATSMGSTTKAIGDNSTSMGTFTEASGYASVAMGTATKAGGSYSFAGGRYMQLGDYAKTTFVWGYSALEPEQLISTANAFLIFPVGTPGKVGIGTADPKQIMHIVGVNPRILVEASSANPEINFKNTGDPTSVIWALYKHSTTDDFRFWQNGGDRITIQSLTGNFGIGTTDPGYLLEVNGNAAKTSGGTTWINSSDVRLKDIAGEYQRGLEEIATLRPVTFFYKEDNPRGLPSNEENVGFVAQEVQDVFPGAISEGSDGYLDFNMHPVNVAMVNAIKELKAENDTLKAKNASFEKEIAKIKKILGI